MKLSISLVLLIIAIVLFQLSLVWLASALEDIFNPRLRGSA